MVRKTAARLSGSFTGSGRKTSASKAVKIAVFTPMPRASVSTATAAKPRFFPNILAPKRRSCTRASTSGSPLRSRTISFVCSTTPSLICACRRASSALIPARRLSSMCIWRWLSISAASSRSRRSFRNNSPNLNSHRRSHFITPSATRDSNLRTLAPNL